MLLTKDDLSIERQNEFITKDNNDCLLIYHTLVEGFEECERTVQPQINVFALFFHQLMKILTGYVLKRNELSGPYMPDKRELEYHVSRFPYISYTDVQRDVEYESKDYSFGNADLSTKRKIFSFFSGAIKPFKKGSISLLSNVLISRDFVIGLLKNGYHVQFLNSFTVGVDSLGSQIKLISKCIEKIFIELRLGVSPEPVIELIKRHILTRVNKNKNINIDCDVIITGSMAELINCFYAATARLSNTPCMSVVHGEGDQLLFNEPYFGYGDRTYPSILFGFGQYPLKGIGHSQYLSSLYNQPQYVASNSDFVKKIYNSNSIIQVKDLDEIKWMYVPDSLLYHRRWGPFGGNIPVKLYIQWQKAVISSFPSIIYKRHPKGHSLFKNLSNTNLKDFLVPEGKELFITCDNFYNIYDQCEGYIFDHISTTFMVAAATNKPIIYFNIGKRNLTKYAENILKKRCLWIDADPANPGDMRERVESIKNITKSNSVTRNFSLDDSNLEYRREEKLFNTIKSMI